MTASVAAPGFDRGPLGPILMRLVVPMFLGMVAIAMVGVVDAYFIGKLGTEALAAFGLCYPAVMVMQALMFGLANGITASVARTRGRRAELGLGGPERLRVKVSVQMSIGLATVLASIGVLFGPMVFRLASTHDIAELALAFYRPYLIALVLLSVPMSLTACMRGFGETRSSATVMTVGSLFNAGLDPLFMFGWGPVPAYGIAGASIATIVGYMVSAGYAIWLASKSLRHADRNGAADDTGRSVAREISSVGGPAMLTQALGPVAAATTTAIIAAFGTEALAALGIMQRIDMLVVIVPVATGAGLMPIAGHLAATGNPRRATEALRLARRSMAGWGVGVGLLLNLAGGPLAALFTDEPEVARVVRLALLFAPVGYICSGLNITTISCFNSVGFPMLATKLSGLFALVLLPISAFTGGRLFELTGVFGGLAFAGVLSAWVGTRWMRRAGLGAATEGAS